MTAPSSIDPARFLHEQLAQASPDLLRQMLTTFINTLMSAEADAVCGAEYGARIGRADQHPQRLPAPGVRHPRRHPGRGDPEAALGVVLPGLAARAPPAGRAGADHRGRDLLPAGGLHPADGEAGRVPRDHPLSKSQVSEMAKDLDAQVADFRHRPLDAGPYTFVAADALVLKVREGGRVVNVHALRRHRRQRRRAPGDPRPAGHLRRGRRRLAGVLPGPDRPRPDRGRSWSPPTRTPAWSTAIGATLPGAAWQRCRTHYAANLMAATPKASWPWVRALLHSVYDQPDAASVHAQFDRILDALADKLPRVAEHLEAARADVLAFTAFPKEVWRQIWSQQPQRAAQPGDPPAHRRRRHLPRPRLADPPGRRRPRRAARRMDRRPPLPRPRRPRPLPHPTGHRHRQRHRGGDHPDDDPGAQRLTDMKITR